MRKKCRIKLRKGLSPFEGGYFEERFGRGDGLKAFSLDDLWGEKGEEVRGGLGGAAGAKGGSRRKRSFTDCLREKGFSFKTE